MTDNSPTLTLGNPPVTIYADRDGDHVTGRVVFPHKTYGRTEIPIDYHSRRPDQARDSYPVDLPRRAGCRLELVQRYIALCNEHPQTARLTHAKRVVKDADDSVRVSVRSLQLWVHKYETGGPPGLVDGYVAPPAKVLVITSQEASAAVQICAWWAYRIGNVETIDNAMVHTAVAHLVRKGYSVADTLATIEVYFTADVDRVKYPFIPFARWVRYHFDTWLLKAASIYDFMRGLVAGKRAKPVRDRRRDAAHRPTRQAIKALDTNGAATVRERPVNQPSNPVRASSALHSMGLRDLAGDVVRAAAVDPPALAVSDDPKTIAESLATLDPSYRRMLLDAARGNRAARRQAIATMPVWWHSMPAGLRNNLDFTARAWHDRHPLVTDVHLASRKLDMILSRIRHNRHGTQALAIAQRIPI